MNAEIDYRRFHAPAARNEQITYGQSLLVEAVGINNNDQPALEAFKGKLGLPEGVTFQSVTDYLNHFVAESDLPTFAIATTLATLSKDVSGFIPDSQEELRLYKPIPSLDMPIKFRFGQTLSWKDILLRISIQAYTYHEILNYFGNIHPDNLSEFVTYLKAEKKSNYGRDLNKMVELGFLSCTDLTITACQSADNQTIFNMHVPGKDVLEYNLTRLLDPIKEAHPNSDRSAYLLCGLFNPTLIELIRLEGVNHSFFKAFGKANATALLDILRSQDFEAIDRLASHWKKLFDTWEQTSAISMNLPVLTHYGPVKDWCLGKAPQGVTSDGRLTPEFIRWIFYEATDEQREEYSQVMVTQIEAGMTMTGVDRIEWDFWKEVFGRMEAENLHAINVVDEGGSAGLVTQQLFTDRRTGALHLKGRLAHVVNVDRIPSEQAMLNRIYRFNPARYDETLELLSQDDATELYNQSLAAFRELHGNIYSFVGSVDTSKADLSAVLKQQNINQAHLILNMRAQGLHGRPEELEAVYQRSLPLLAEGGRFYLQRGLPIYGHLVLGVLYKKIKGQPVVEAIQLNNHGESVTVWRLDRNGNESTSWKDEIRAIYG